MTTGAAVFFALLLLLAPQARIEHGVLVLREDVVRDATLLAKKDAVTWDDVIDLDYD